MILRRLAAIDAAGEHLLRRAMKVTALTARGYDRLLRVARTIADLEGDERVGAQHLAEALQFRQSPIDVVESAHSNLLETRC